MSGKVTVKITGRGEFTAHQAGKQIGQGTITSQGNGTYGHADGCGWGFKTQGTPTAESIAAALTDEHNSLYIIE